MFAKPLLREADDVIFCGESDDDEGKVAATHGEYVVAAEDELRREEPRGSGSGSGVVCLGDSGAGWRVDSSLQVRRREFFRLSSPSRPPALIVTRAR